MYDCEFYLEFTIEGGIEKISGGFYRVDILFLFYHWFDWMHDPTAGRAVIA